MRGGSRTITALFTDMVGSTSAMSRLGHAADRLHTLHFSLLRSALAVHHGSEVKSVGDGLMAVFDSAADAVACAVTMQRGAADHGRRHSDLAFELRIGISAGEATCHEGDYYGTSVVEASRLCDAASGGQILLADVVRALLGSNGIHRLTHVGERSLKGLPAPVSVWQAEWDPGEDFTLRVALADDSVLLREGLAKVLESQGIDVVLQVSDADSLLEAVGGARPHVAVIDVRMPPTHTTEGLLAAERIRAEHPEIGVLVLSQSVVAGAARRLLGDGSEGVGYMLKESVTDVDELVGAIRTIASGGSAIAAEVVAKLAADAA